MRGDGEIFVLRPEVVYGYDERKKTEIEKEIKAQLFFIYKKTRGEILHSPLKKTFLFRLSQNTPH